MNEWRQCEVRDVANFNPSERLLKNSVAKKIPMGCIQVSGRKITGFEIAEYKSGPKFRNGDTLLAKITPCLENGKTAYVDILAEGEVAFGSSEFIVLRAKKESDSDFVYYLARSPAFRKKAISCMEGTSGRKRVNEGALKLQPIRCPDIAGQKKISAVLSALDAKIELNNRINAELEAMAKTLFDYWFVQFDFPFDFAKGRPAANGRPYKSSGGKMVYNPTLKREIPEGWEASNILKVADLLGGGTPSKKKAGYWNGGIPFFTPSDADGAVYKFKTEDSISVEGLKKSSTKLFEPNTVFITARGSVGRLVLAGTEMAMNQSCYALKAKPGISYAYLFYLTRELIHHLEVKASGSVFNSIVSNDIEWTQLAIADSSIIEIYASIIEPAFKRISCNTLETLHLTSLRDFLLPMLMNGQVQVG